MTAGIIAGIIALGTAAVRLGVWVKDKRSERRRAEEKARRELDAKIMAAVQERNEKRVAGGDETV